MYALKFLFLKPTFLISDYKKHIMLSPPSPQKVKGIEVPETALIKILIIQKILII